MHRLEDQLWQEHVHANACATHGATNIHGAATVQARYVPLDVPGPAPVQLQAAGVSVCPSNHSGGSLPSELEGAPSEHRRKSGVDQHGPIWPTGLCHGCYGAVSRCHCCPGCTTQSIPVDRHRGNKRRLMPCGLGKSVPRKRRRWPRDQARRHQKCLPATEAATSPPPP